MLPDLPLSVCLRFVLDGIVDAVRRFVWVEAWQFQCCGDPFSIGSTVHWDLGPADGEWIARLLGPDRAKQVRLVEEHHEGPDTSPVEGVVKAIAAVTCSRILADDPDYPGEQVWVPMPGSATIRDVVESDPWEPESPPQTTFDGWIVELEIDPIHA